MTVDTDTRTLRHTPTSAQLMRRAREEKTAIPAFNIPYLPMMEPVIQALRDTQCMGFIAVARLEWVKFESQSLQAVAREYGRVGDPECSRLHLDHVPVIDEDNLNVDFESDIRAALDAGYDSVMIDGSRLDLESNIAASRDMAVMAHNAGAAIEAELGAILGHESGPLPPYEELFASGRGFTDPEEARRFVSETEVDWLSVAVGSIHGSIAPAAKAQKKVEARLSIAHLGMLNELLEIPLVLHGGTGIRKADILAGIAHGISKINIGTAIRQPYEAHVGTSVSKAQEAVYLAARNCIEEDLELAGSASRLLNSTTKGY